MAIRARAQTAPFPPLAWLRAFEAAARHLSFTQAGKELNMTQSSISQHVRNLEHWLGRELFVRQTRALALTEAGANYLPVVREAFGVLARGTRSFVGGDPGQELRLLCNLTFATWWLCPRLDRLMNAHPWLKLDLQTATWGVEAISTSGAGAPNWDLEIRFARPQDVSASAELLLEDSITPICAPDFADGAPDWRRDRLFDCAGTMSNWEAWLDSQGLSLPSEQVVHRASTYVIALTAAVTGQGLALAHGFMIEGLAKTCAVHQPWAHRMPLFEAYFLQPPPEHRQTPATRAFMAWIEDEMTSAAPLTA